MPTGSTDRAEAVRKAMVEWYRVHAAVHLPGRVAYWARKLRLQVPPVLIRSQQRRWGSCDPTGTLRFNWRIIQALMHLVDYVVAHELVHLIHKDHTPEYWRVLGKVLHDHEQERDALKLMGGRFVW